LWPALPPSPCRSYKFAGVLTYGDDGYAAELEMRVERATGGIDGFSTFVRNCTSEYVR